MVRQEDTALSAQMAAAQEQLYQRRQQCRQERLSKSLSVHTDSHGRTLLPPPNTATPNIYPPGWESQALARSLHASEARKIARRETQEALSLTWLPEHPAGATEKAPTIQHHSTKTVEAHSFTLHPDLAIAMLHQNLSSPGRLWLLLRRIDEEGRGWINVSQARTRLTDIDSPLRICGWRQLRNLLAQGEGIFWQRNDQSPSPNRIWLRSPAKVAIALGLKRLHKKPVAVPLTVLLDTIGTVRAHFFASFHSGRDSNNPIARQTLADVTGVSRRTQRSYEKRARVKGQHNWAVGQAYSKKAMQQRAWQHGRAVFQLKDTNGKVGTAGKSYIAWQMPNSYSGPHKPQATTHKKRINQKLTDLLNKGITGNGERKVEEPVFQHTGSEIRYYEHGRAAARAYNRNARSDHYWRTPTAYRHRRVWHLLQAQGGAKA